MDAVVNGGRTSPRVCCDLRGSSVARTVAERDPHDRVMTLSIQSTSAEARAKRRRLREVDGSIVTSRRRRFERRDDEAVSTRVVLDDDDLAALWNRPFVFGRDDHTNGRTVVGAKSHLAEITVDAR
jgi:hypothetical protein